MVNETDPAVRDYRKWAEWESIHDRRNGCGMRRGFKCAIQTSRRSFILQIRDEQVDCDLAKQQSKGLQPVIAIQEAQFQYNHSSNAALRRSFRAEKREIKKNEAAVAQLGLSIP